MPPVETNPGRHCEQVDVFPDPARLAQLRMDAFTQVLLEASERPTGQERHEVGLLTEQERQGDVHGMQVLLAERKDPVKQLRQTAVLVGLQEAHLLETLQGRQMLWAATKYIPCMQTVQMDGFRVEQVIQPRSQAAMLLVELLVESKVYPLGLIRVLHIVLVVQEAQ